MTGGGTPRKMSSDLARRRFGKSGTGLAAPWDGRRAVRRGRGGSRRRESLAGDEKKRRILTSSGEAGVPTAIGASRVVPEGLCGMAEPAEAIVPRGVVGNSGRL